MRWSLRVLGCLLILPFPVAFVWGWSEAADCTDDCHGNIVYVVLLLFLALPAIAGGLVLATTFWDDKVRRHEDSRCGAGGVR